MTAAGHQHVGQGQDVGDQHRDGDLGHDGYGIDLGRRGDLGHDGDLVRAAAGHRSDEGIDDHLGHWVIAAIKPSGHCSEDDTELDHLRPVA